MALTAVRKKTCKDSIIYSCCGNLPGSLQQPCEPELLAAELPAAAPAAQLVELLAVPVEPAVGPAAVPALAAELAAVLALALESADIGNKRCCKQTALRRRVQNRSICRVIPGLS